MFNLTFFSYYNACFFFVDYYLDQHVSQNAHLLVTGNFKKCTVHLSIKSSNIDIVSFELEKKIWSNAIISFDSKYIHI